MIMKGIFFGRRRIKKFLSFFLSFFSLLSLFLKREREREREKNEEKIAQGYHYRLHIPACLHVELLTVGI
jgi:hypothetical protein